MSDSVRATLAALVAAAAHPPVDPASIADDTALLGTSGLALDSLSLLDVVVGLESRLGVVVPPEDVQAKHFGTFALLSSYVASRGASPRPPA